MNTTEACTWQEDADGVWDTECGGRFIVEDGLPTDNGMKFCCYCGRHLRQALFVPPGADDES